MSKIGHLCYIPGQLNISSNFIRGNETIVIGMSFKFSDPRNKFALPRDSRASDQSLTNRELRIMMPVYDSINHKSGKLERSLVDVDKDFAATLPFCVISNGQTIHTVRISDENTVVSVDMAKLNIFYIKETDNSGRTYYRPASEEEVRRTKAEALKIKGGKIISVKLKEKQKGSDTKGPPGFSNSE